mmetsp:Transcript_7996/g.10721  ORF Transcript_7996/g.10721 Transcript_7996/m.10721 type:complete len:276 (+) Transcript_7996:103-930(+)
MGNFLFCPPGETPCPNSAESSDLWFPVQTSNSLGFSVTPQRSHSLLTLESFESFDSLESEHSDDESSYYASISLPNESVREAIIRDEFTFWRNPRTPPPPAANVPALPPPTTIIGRRNRRTTRQEYDVRDPLFYAPFNMDSTERISVERDNVGTKRKKQISIYRCWKQDAIELNDTAPKPECAICLQPITKVNPTYKRLRCSHANQFHLGCIEKHFELSIQRASAECPLCRSLLRSDSEVIQETCLSLSSSARSSGAPFHRYKIPPSYGSRCCLT